MNKVSIRSVAVYNFEQARDDYEEAEHIMSVEFFGFRDFLPQAEYEQAREYLRDMPQCATKVLFFREIIMHETTYINPLGN